MVDEWTRGWLAFVGWLGGWVDGWRWWLGGWVAVAMVNGVGGWARGWPVGWSVTQIFLSEGGPQLLSRPVASLRSKN